MTLKEKTAAARAAGISDDEIWAGVKPTQEYSKAIAAGQDDSAIGQYLGFKSPGAVSGEATPAAAGEVEGEAPPLTSSNALQKAEKIGALAGTGLVKGAVEGTVGLPGSLLSL